MGEVLIYVLSRDLQPNLIPVTLLARERCLVFGKGFPGGCPDLTPVTQAESISPGPLRLRTSGLRSYLQLVMVPTLGT